MTSSRAFAWLAAGMLLSCVAALGAAPRTIVVRGRAFSPDGRPLGGARVTARGTVSVNTVTDDRGRYTLSVPLGMPAALRRLPFRLEVRTESGGRRLPLASGGQALVLDAAWQVSSGRVRVQSNHEAAATAVATALEVEEVAIAWIDADFGGAAKERGAGVYALDVSLPGAAQGRGPEPPPSPRNGAPATTPLAGAVPRDSVQAGAPAAPAAPADVPRIVATTRTVEAPLSRPSAVRAIGPYARPDSAAVADTCRCALRGTVEIDWVRPLEDHTPVRIELDAPGAPVTDLLLFMGAPREFRFGPLPCGTWRLAVRAGGKLRYADAHGDTTRVIPCAGPTETRVVLVPVRR